MTERAAGEADASLWCEHDNAERMLTEVCLGVPKAAARSVPTEADARLWDRLAAEVARIRVAGRIVDYDVDWDEECGGPLRPRTG